MHEIDNNAASSGGHGLSHQEPAVTENQASNASTETPAKATSRNCPGLSQDAGNPDPSKSTTTTVDGDSQNDSTGNSNSYTQRRAPLKEYWELEIIPILKQHQKDTVKAGAILDTLMDRHGSDLEGYERKSMLRWLER